MPGHNWFPSHVLRHVANFNLSSWFPTPFHSAPPAPTNFRLKAQFMWTQQFRSNTKSNRTFPARLAQLNTRIWIFARSGEAEAGKSFCLPGSFWFMVREVRTLEMPLFCVFIQMLFPTHEHIYTRSSYVPRHKSINEIYTHISCYVPGGNSPDKAPFEGSGKLSPLETRICRIIDAIHFSSLGVIWAFYGSSSRSGSRKTS